MIHPAGEPDPSLQSTSITILGAGLWGSTLHQLIQAKGYPVRLWSRSGSTPLAANVAGATVIISAIAMKGVTEMSMRLQGIPLPSTTILLSATKGLDAKTTRTPSQIWETAFPRNPIAVLSGPNLSEEIGQELPAATVVASGNLQAATTIQQIFASETFRVYTNPDRLGTELGGTLKNVIAIAVGVCDGLRLGTNARAALMTRALPEMIRMGTYLGGKTETFWGLSGLGDLLATATSHLSRNYQVGYQLAQGKSLPQILVDLHSTAEGVNTTQVLMQLAQKDQIVLPIATQVYRLLQSEITPQAAVAALMERELKPELFRKFFCVLNIMNIPK